MTSVFSYGKGTPGRYAIERTPFAMGQPRFNRQTYPEPDSYLERCTVWDNGHVIGGYTLLHTGGQVTLLECSGVCWGRAV